MVFRDLSLKNPKAIKRPMCAFMETTRVRIVNESKMKIPVQFFVNEMVDDSIAYLGFMNIAWFWIGDIKCRIRTMYIRFVFEVRIETRKVFRKFGLKLYDVFLVFLATQKPLPSQE